MSDTPRADTILHVYDFDGFAAQYHHVISGEYASLQPTSNVRVVLWGSHSDVASALLAAAAAAVPQMDAAALTGLAWEADRLATLAERARQANDEPAVASRTEELMQTATDLEAYGQVLFDQHSAQVARSIWAIAERVREVALCAGDGASVEDVTA